MKRERSKSGSKCDSPSARPKGHRPRGRPLILQKMGPVKEAQEEDLYSSLVELAQLRLDELGHQRDEDAFVGNGHCRGRRLSSKIEHQHRTSRARTARRELVVARAFGVGLIE